MTQGFAPLFVVAIVVAALPLSGCQSFNRAIGKTRVIPDEFQVVSNAPLAMPPNYSLHPPRVGNGPEQISPTQQARESVFRAAGAQQASLPKPDTTQSKGEADLLREAGVANVPPDIRQLVNSDPAQGVPFARSLVDRLLFWEGPKTPPADQVINPSAEASRLRMSETLAKTTGPAPAPKQGLEVPTFERTKSSSSWFGWLF